MARTVAEIDGDSSGLVGALDQGRKGMQKMEAEGKKLSDQLREVADDADKAAGAMVQKIGGPGAIKAIGGIGVAMGVAKAGVEAFLGSAESLFRSFGDQGQKVWDDTEKSLFAIKGAFAEAVLGGGSVEQMGARLKSIFEGVKTAVDFALTPIKLLSQAFIDNSVGANQAATATKLYNEAVEQSTKTTASQITLVGELTQKYLALTNQTDALKLSEIGQSLAKIRMQQAEVWATEKKNDEAAAQMEVAAQREKIRHEAYLQWSKPHKRVPIYPGSSTYYDPRENEQVRDIEEDMTNRALVAARAKYADLSVETRLQLDQLKGLYDMFGALYAEVGKKVAEPPKTVSAVSHAGTTVVDKVTEAVQAASEKLSGVFGDVSEQFKQDSATVAAGFQGWLTGFSPTEGFVDSWRTALSDVTDMFTGFFDAVFKGNQEMTQSSTATAEAHSAFYDKYIGQSAKMVAISLASGKSMAEVAQATIGTIISALGDEALARASIEFFKGNFWAASGLTAAGMAAYATASYLGSTAKKSGSSTKATAKEAPVVNQNTSYNLQIDAAFADEESIARSFAKAQAIAKMRHLTPYAMT